MNLKISSKKKKIVIGEKRRKIADEDLSKIYSFSGKGPHSSIASRKHSKLDETCTIGQKNKNIWHLFLKQYFNFKTCIEEATRRSSDSDGIFFLCTLDQPVYYRRIFLRKIQIP